MVTRSSDLPLLAEQADVVDDDRQHQDEQEHGERRAAAGLAARNAWVYISLATTLVSKLPPVIVRTMSKTFSVAIEIVVSTTISAGRMPGS